jgi:hypothetical protein
MRTVHLATLHIACVTTVLSVGNLQAAPPGAHPPAATDQELLQFVQSRVFKIVSDTGSGTSLGSAVLIQIARKEGPGGEDVGTFVTAYHGPRQRTP